MKKLLRITTALLLVMMMLFASSAICVNAADDALDVDGRVSYAVGDTMTYTFYLGDTVENLWGLQMYVKYDPTYLKLNQDTIATPNLKGSVVYNDTTGSTTIDEGFIFTYVDVNEKTNFNEKKVLFALDFEVLKAGETEITYIIEEMYGKDLTYLKQYTLSVSYSENGTVIKDEVPPVVNKDPDFVADHNGQFINFEDGKGQDNPDVKEEDRQIVTADPNYIPQNNVNANTNAPEVQDKVDPTDVNGNLAPTDSSGNMLPTNSAGAYLDEQGNELSTDAEGNYLDKDGKFYQMAMPYEKSFMDILMEVWWIIALGVVAIAVIVVAVILIVKNNKKKPEVEEVETEEITDEDFDLDLDDFNLDDK